MAGQMSHADLALLQRNLAPKQAEDIGSPPSDSVVPMALLLVEIAIHAQGCCGLREGCWGSLSLRVSMTILPLIPSRGAVGDCQGPSQPARGRTPKLHGDGH
jgi:histidine ammonia-lyase